MPTARPECLRIVLMSAIKLVGDLLQDAKVCLFELPRIAWVIKG